YRIVDHDEAERALGERGARHEQAERPRVELALAHDTERRALAAVGRAVARDAPPRALARELDPPELDVALLAQVLPDAGRFLGDRREAVVADPGRGLLEPGLRGLEALELGRSAHGVARRLEPGGHLDRQRPPRVLLAPELGARRVAERRDRVAQRPARLLEMIGHL